MERVSVFPRKDYKKKIEGLGFDFHQNYWTEDAYYRFSSREIEMIETATAECYKMYCTAVEHVIKYNLWKELFIPEEIVPAIVGSWEEDELSLYGRFDFAFVNGIPKLLEFNADTPTSLFEASIVQWNWKEELFPEADQFNSIHEALIQSWKDIHDAYGYSRYDFSCVTDSPEDYTTTSYICSTANLAGLDTSMMDIEDVVYEGDSFYTPGMQPIDCMFALYPYEWMFNEFPQGIISAGMSWIEPLWKSVMSNKYILVIISKLFPDSPYILKAYTEPFGFSYCKKPIYSREGANVTLVRNGVEIETSGGDYGEEGYIYQEFAEILPHDSMYPIIGSWVIGGEPAGMGIRETASRITDNQSYFVPHILKKNPSYSLEPNG